MRVTPIPGLPEVQAGDDLAVLLVAALDEADLTLRNGDVLVVSAKVVSKADNLRVPALERVGAVLAASTRVVAERATGASVTRITESSAGPVLAAAGIDASNTGSSDANSPSGDTVLLLPPDADGSASALRERVCGILASRGDTPPARLGFVLSDTAGRPWRHGQTDFALGCAGLIALADLRGTRDADGRELHVSVTAVADEIASAADLVRPKDARVAAALVRGLPGHLVPECPHRNSPDRIGRGLVRTGPTDWFALGHVEAVRSALGVAPGTAAAIDVGIPAADAEPVELRVERAIALSRLDSAVVAPPAPCAGLPDPHPRACLLTRPVALGEVRADIVQEGILLEAPDELTLGVFAARLLVALEAEALSGRLGSHSPAGGRHAPRILVVLL